MANHMAEVAKILGVELGEEFEVQTTDLGCLTATINEQDIYVPKCEGYYPEYNKSIILRNLIRGKYTIESKPWKPSYYERYYSVGPGGVLEPGTWLNDLDDLALFKLGNCYSSVSEAEANRGKWVKFYASDGVLEV